MKLLSGKMEHYGIVYSLLCHGFTMQAIRKKKKNHNILDMI